MQPLVLLGIVAAFALVVGTGAMAPSIEQVWIQSLGVGEHDIEAPITDASLDLRVAPIVACCDEDGSEFWKNRFVSCTFHSGESPIDGPLSAVICKLLDSNGNAIAEGRLDFCSDPIACPQGEYTESQEYIIEPLEESYEGSLELGNVAEIKLVVIGDHPSDD